MAGIKNDQGKPSISLIPAESLELTAHALTFGAAKYGRWNYREGIAHSRMLDAAFRHLLAEMRGESLDPESGLPHIAHALASLSMLAWMRANRPDLDDSYQYKKESEDNE